MMTQHFMPGLYTNSLRAPHRTLLLLRALNAWPDAQAEAHGLGFTAGALVPSSRSSTSTLLRIFRRTKPLPFGRDTRTAARAVNWFRQELDELFKYSGLASLHHARAGAH